MVLGGEVEVLWMVWGCDLLAGLGLVGLGFRGRHDIIGL